MFWKPATFACRDQVHNVTVFSSVPRKISNVRAVSKARSLANRICVHCLIPYLFYPYLTSFSTLSHSGPSQWHSGQEWDQPHASSRTASFIAFTDRQCGLYTGPAYSPASSPVSLSLSLDEELDLGLESHWKNSKSSFLLCGFQMIAPNTWSNTIPHITKCIYPKFPSIPKFLSSCFPWLDSTSWKTSEQAFVLIHAAGINWDLDRDDQRWVDSPIINSCSQKVLRPLS